MRTIRSTVDKQIILYRVLHNISYMIIIRILLYILYYYVVAILYFQNGSLVKEDPLVLYEWAGLRKKNTSS